MFLCVAVFHLIEGVRQWDRMTPEFSLLGLSSAVLCVANTLTALEMNVLLTNSNGILNNLPKTTPVLVISFCVIVQIYENNVSWSASVGLYVNMCLQFALLCVIL